MANYPNLSEEEIKAVKLQRKRNTIMMALIGLALVVLLAVFSPNPYVSYMLVGIIAVIIVMLFARRYLERKAMARHAEQAQIPPEIEEEQ